MRCLIFNLGNAMYKTLAVLLLLASTACKPKNKPAASIVKTDTIIPVMDTAILPYTAADLVRDSLERKHKLDSFNAIKPIITYTYDTNLEPLDKLIADVIDTTGVTTTPLTLSDTTIQKWNKEGNQIYHRQLLKNNRFTIELVDTGPNNQREIIINGYTLRKGSVLDTSVSDAEDTDYIEIQSGRCALLKFGAKEYLLLVAGLENCNGIGCGVRFYVLYDPVIKKGMILQQFRSEFYAGYDKKNKTPVFIDMENYEHNGLYQCFLTSGNVYQFNHDGKVKPLCDKAGKQIEFMAYAKNFDSPLHVIKGNFIRSN